MPIISGRNIISPTAPGYGAFIQQGNDVESNVFAYLKGRTFGDWITGRTNRPLAGDLIETPDAVIESLLRDEIHTERDLEIATVPNATTFTATANVEIDDFYNGAYVHNVTQNDTVLISDYVASTQTFTVSSTAGWSSGDKIFLSNVNCDIVTSSFDSVGNTVDGTRRLWKFARSLNVERSSRQLINQLLFESHCMLFETYNGYKLTALETPSTVSGTFTNPLYIDGEPNITVGLTSIDDIYTSFILNYGYDYGSRTYKKQVRVDKNGSSDSTNLGSGYQDKCYNAGANYRVNRTYEANLDWIQDDNTASYLCQKLVDWHTSQRNIISFTGDFETYHPYEIGDYVKVNYDYMLPTGVNNASIFLITSKNIDISKKKVGLTLLS